MSVVFFGRQGLEPVLPNIPFRVLFLTSLRDVVADDRNGETIFSAPHYVRYMRGAVEETARQSLPGGRLHKIVEVVGLVTDDTTRDCERFNLAALPEKQGRWIVPSGVDLGVPAFNLPSNFRLLPMSDLTGRAQAKLEFEEAVLAVAQGVRADVVISDHYMARLAHLHRWMPRRVLNIHPAVTLPGHLCRFVGKSPTADALAHARANGGTAHTGATLHWVDDEIDHGPPVAFSSDTPVFADDEPMWLRYRNYQQGKLPVLVQGLHHYATRLFPYLNELDLNQLAEL